MTLVCRDTFTLIFLIFLSFSWWSCVSWLIHEKWGRWARMSHDTQVTTHSFCVSWLECRDSFTCDMTHSLLNYWILWGTRRFSQGKWEEKWGKWENCRGKMRKMRKLSRENEKIVSGKWENCLGKMRELSRENEKIVSGKWENCLGKMRELSRENERIVSGQTNEIFKHKWENYLRNKEILSGKWKKTIHVTWIIHVIFFLRNNERVGQRVGHRKWAMSHE